MTILREPLEADNVEVLGHRVKADSPAWTGLDWSRPVSFAEDRIRLPWCHPDDQTGSPDDFDCIYSIYPRPEAGKRWKRKMVKSARFERDGEKYFVVVEV